MEMYYLKTFDTLATDGCITVAASIIGTMAWIFRVGNEARRIQLDFFYLQLNTGILLLPSSVRYRMH